MFIILIKLFFIFTFMPVICWGPLAKSAQDPTTIADYIESKILDHNVNPSAHGLDGYAVYAHRASPAIDHPVGSVLANRFSASEDIRECAFESLDAWTKSGGVDVLNWPGVNLNASGSPTGHEYLSSVLTDPLYWFDYTKDQ